MKKFLLTLSAFLCSIGIGWAYEIGDNCLYLDMAGTPWSDQYKPFVAVKFSNNQTIKYAMTEVANSNGTTTDYWVLQHEKLQNVKEFRFYGAETADGTENWSSAIIQEDCTYPAAYTHYTTEYGTPLFRQEVVGVKDVTANRDFIIISGNGKQGTPYVIDAGTPIKFEVDATKIGGEDDIIMYNTNLSSLAVPLPEDKKVTVYDYAVGNKDYQVTIEACSSWENRGLLSRTTAVGPIYIHTNTSDVAANYGKVGEGSIIATVDGNTYTSGATIQQGQTVEFTATPKEGYRIEGWYSDADCFCPIADASATYTIDHVEGNPSVYVKFVEDKPVAALNNAALRAHCIMKGLDNIKSVVFTNYNSEGYINDGSSFTYSYRDNVIGNDVWCFSDNNGNIAIAAPEGKTIVADKDCTSLFESMTSLETIDLSNLDMSQVTNTAKMFKSCSSLKTVDMRNVRSVRVTSMTEMFAGCSNLETIFASDEFVTVNATSSDNMFSNCPKLKGPSGSSAKAQKIDKTCAHLDGGLLAPGFFTGGVAALDVNKFNRPSIRSAVNGSLAFVICEMLPEGVTEVKSDGNTLKLDDDNILRLYTDGNGAYYVAPTTKATRICAVDGQDLLAGFSGVTVFYLYNFDTRSVYTMRDMFRDCSSLETIVIGDFFEACKFGSGMFVGCTALKGYRGTTFNPYCVDKDYARIDDPDNEKPGYLTPRTVSFTAETFRKVLDKKIGDSPIHRLMEKVSFTWTENLPNDIDRDNAIAINDDATLRLYPSTQDNSTYYVAPILSGTVIEATTLGYTGTDNSYQSIFPRPNQTVKEIHMDNFNTRNCTNMASLFNACGYMKTLTLGKDFKTDKVTSMNKMFAQCYVLSSLDISGFNTSCVTDMERMFYSCIALANLSIGNFNMSKVTESSYITDNLASNVKTTKSITFKALPYLKDGVFNNVQWDNVIYDLNLNDTTLVNGGKFHYPTVTEYATTPTYRRVMNNEWGTILVPFPVKYDADNGSYKLYKHTGTSANAITLTEYEDEAIIACSTPMVIKAVGSKNSQNKYVVKLTANENTVNTYTKKTSAVDGLNMEGTYEKGNYGGVFFIAENQFWWAEETISVAPFRAWFEGNLPNSSNAKSLNIIVEDETTGISELNAEGLELRDGKYLERGKVIILKNGIKYNANGQRIK